MTTTAHDPNEQAEQLKAQWAASPNNTELIKELSRALIRNGKPQEADEVIQHGINLAENDRGIYLEYIAVKTRLGQLDLANKAAHRVHGSWFANERLFEFTPCLVQLADVEKIGELGDVLGLLEGFPPDRLANALSTPLIRGANTSVDNIRRFIDQQKRWARYIEDYAAQNPIDVPRGSRHSRTRLAFFGIGTIGILRSLIYPVLQNIDRSRFEVQLYFVNVGNQRVIDEELRPLGGHIDKIAVWQNAPNQRLAQALAHEDIDLLIELNGIQQTGTKVGALAWRPATVQLTWAGTPTPCPLAAVDYQILDRFLVPHEDEFSVDNPLLLPGSWVCYGEMPEFELVEQVPSDRNGWITFGVSAAPHFMNKLALETWAEILLDRPECQLLFMHPGFGSERARSNVSRIFERRGVGDRIDFRYEKAGSQRHMLHYNDVDVLLDRFPISGGIGLLEAMHMGVPGVSLYGPAVHTRMGYSQLRHVGLDDLCAQDIETYRERALAIADDTTRRRELRRDLRERVRAETTFTDLPAFMRDFQAALESIAQRHL